MFRRAARATVPVLAVSFLVSGSGVAPLHAHQSGARHSHAVVHSHFEPHHHGVRRDDAAPEIEQGDRIVWLVTAAVHALPFRLDAPTAVLIRVPVAISEARSWSVITVDESAPPHGPPRSSASLRAPPILPV